MLVIISTKFLKSETVNLYQIFSLLVCWCAILRTQKTRQKVLAQKGQKGKLSNFVDSKKRGNFCNLPTAKKELICNCVTMSNTVIKYILTVRVLYPYFLVSLYNRSTNMSFFFYKISKGRFILYLKYRFMLRKYHKASLFYIKRSVYFIISL